MFTKLFVALFGTRVGQLPLAMVPDSVSLVHTLHSRLLIALCTSTGTLCQGIRQATAQLRRRKAIMYAQSKTLERLDDAFNVAPTHHAGQL
eukprot:440543-Amphidinium_carterae.1